MLPLTEPFSTCAADVDFDINDINVDELEVGDMGELQIYFDGDRARFDDELDPGGFSFGKGYAEGEAGDRMCASVSAAAGGAASGAGGRGKVNDSAQGQGKSATVEKAGLALKSDDIEEREREKAQRLVRPVPKEETEKLDALRPASPALGVCIYVYISVYMCI